MQTTNVGFKLDESLLELEEKSKSKKKTKGKDKDEPILSAYFKGLVDLVVHDNGKIVYLVKVDGHLEVATTWEVDKVLYLPPDQKCLPFKVANANKVLQWGKSDNDSKLFEDVLIYLKRFSYLPDNQWLIVACNVFLSYLQDHPDIHYLLMLLFYAVPERGKSRTGKAVVYISFRGVHVVDLREANLFRYAENLKATLFFDMMDLWKKAEKNGAEDILLLRYEKGAKATRVIYPEKGAFRDTVYYDIFGSTIIATNEPVHKILGSRCIDISMPNKPGNYENPTPEKAQELKERLIAWRARVMDRPLPGIDVIQGLSGRLWDISKPLLQVCKLVYPQGYIKLTNALLEVAGETIKDRKESVEGQIVTALYELSPQGLSEWKVKVSDLLETLNAGRPEGYKLTSQYVGRKLKAMSLQTKISTGGYSQIFLNCYDFNTLLQQYGCVCEKTPLNSTILNLPTESRQSDSGVLVESGKTPPKLNCRDSLQNQGELRIVESSGVSGRAGDSVLDSFKIVEEVEVLG